MIHHDLFTVWDLMAWWYPSSNIAIEHGLFMPFQWERPLQMDAMEEFPLPDSVGGGPMGPTSQPLRDGFRFIKDMIQKNALRWPVDQYL